MKTLKQIIKDIDSYQCSEGIEKDRELRTLTLRVDLLLDAYTLIETQIKNIDNSKTPFLYLDDLFLIFTNLDSNVRGVQERIGIGLGQNTVYQCLQTLNIAFKRDELLAKYEGNDKKFVENIANDVDEYFFLTYGK